MQATLAEFHIQNMDLSNISGMKINETQYFRDKFTINPLTKK